TRFSVNLVAGQHAGADIAFHFNPRFDGWDKVVFNSMQGGRWGSEEKKRSMPFRKGTAFELVIMVLAEHYKVVVNGNPFYEFGHRLPLQMVTHLQVDGDLELQSINFIGGNPPPSQVRGVPSLRASYPTQARGTRSALKWESAAPSLLQSQESGPRPPPPLETQALAPVSFPPPSLSAFSFAINFVVGSTGDLALHINSRLTEDVVVRNSFLNGSWGSEEKKITYNPFGPGKFFDVSLGSLLPPSLQTLCPGSSLKPALPRQLSIRCGIDRFKVYANGQHLFDYSHRVSAFQNVDVLEIQGDINLSYVQV
ncbi:LEG4 protein, partial [Crocuta crocuta]